MIKDRKLCRIHKLDKFRSKPGQEVYSWFYNTDPNRREND